MLNITKDWLKKIVRILTLLILSYGIYEAVSSTEDCECSDKEYVIKDVQEFFKKNDLDLCSYMCDSHDLQNNEIQQIIDLQTSDAKIREQLNGVKILILAKLDMKRYKEFVSSLSSDEISRLSLIIFLGKNNLEYPNAIYSFLNYFKGAYFIRYRAKIEWMQTEINCKVG